MTLFNGMGTLPLKCLPIESRHLLDHCLAACATGGFLAPTFEDTTMLVVTGLYRSKNARFYGLKLQIAFSEAPYGPIGTDLRLIEALQSLQIESRHLLDHWRVPVEY